MFPFVVFRWPSSSILPHLLNYYLPFFISAGKNNAQAYIFHLLPHSLSLSPVSHNAFVDINKFSSSLMIQFIVEPFNVLCRGLKGKREKTLLPWSHKAFNRFFFSSFLLVWFICDDSYQSVLQIRMESHKRVVYRMRKPNYLTAICKKWYCCSTKFLTIRLLYVPPCLTPTHYRSHLINLSQTSFYHIFLSLL